MHLFRVLLVDDEQIILDGLKNLICWQEFGFSEVDAATSVQQALAMIAKQPYDVLITDIRMRDLSGIDLLRHIHECRIPIKTIVLSSYSNFSYIKAALQYGIENYLLKPVDEDELRSTLSHVVEKIALKRESSYYAHMKESVMLENTLELWMKGDISIETVSERLSFYGIKPNYSFYITGIIHSVIHLPAGERDYELRETVVHKLIARYKTPTGRLIAVWTVNDQLLITLCRNSAITREEFQGIASEVCELCRQTLRGDWRYVLGFPVAHSSKIFESYLDCSRQLSAESNDAEEKSMHPVIRQIVRELHQNYSYGYSLKLLANRYNLSQAYLGRLFKTEVGKLFTDYLCEIRLEAAKKLLEETDMKSCDIAAQVGFQNQNYFSNVFKKCVGVYPSVYRNRRASQPH